MVWRGGGGKKEIIYLLLHCHHQNDSCIILGSDERHFNVSLIMMGKVTRLSTNQKLFEGEGKPKQNRAEALQPYTLQLGQTGSQLLLRIKHGA